MEFLKEEFKTSEIEALKKTCIRWGVLQCLREFLYATRVDVSYYPDLEVARSMIETSLHKKYASTRTIMDVDDLLDKAQIKLSIKATLLTSFTYWEDLLNKAKKGKVTRKEAIKVPFMESLIRKYEFLNYCLPVETEPIKPTINV